MAGSPDFGADPPWIPSGSRSAPKQIPWSSPCIFSAVNPFFAYHSPRMHRRHTHTFRRPPCFFTRFWILLGKARQSASTSRSRLISSQHAFKREAYSCRVSSQGFVGNVLAKRLLTYVCTLTELHKGGRGRGTGARRLVPGGEDRLAHPPPHPFKSKAETLRRLTQTTESLAFDLTPRLKHPLDHPLPNGTSPIKF